MRLPAEIDGNFIGFLNSQLDYYNGANGFRILPKTNEHLHGLLKSTIALIPLLKSSCVVHLRTPNLNLKG